MSLEKHSHAVDHSHHLSELAKARKPSPLKDLIKYITRDDLIPLAGGMPHPAYFPFSAIHVDGLATDSFSVAPPEPSSSFSWLWKLFGAKEKTIPFTIHKYPQHPGDVNLATALQYDTATGMAQLKQIIKEFTGKVYQPAYGDWEILCNTGATDGWSRVVQTLCNPGEYLLAEEWAYPSALAAALPYGVKPLPVAIDGEGMQSDHLRKLLAEWDEAARGAKRPHVMYTVPVGQNPTGATMGLARKQEIYNICIEYDIIIVEDDPYYFLQMPTYVSKANRNADKTHETDPVKYLAGLVPSYVKIDYQGRVIRLDTFSKTVAPGSRLGWFTCSPMFAERLLRVGETSTQAPCGIGQALITQLLLTWKFDGYARWLQGLGREYTNRRDSFVDSLVEAFHIRASPCNRDFRMAADVYDAFIKTEGSNEKDALGDTRIFSFVAPRAGMFVWIKFYFDHPAFRNHAPESLEMQLFIKLVEAGVLFAPGYIFSAQLSDPSVSTFEGHYRISFSSAEVLDMRKAVKIFADVSKKFMRELSTGQ